MESMNITVDGIKLIVRPMKFDDIEQLLPMLMYNYWPVTLSDVRMMYQGDPNGFIGVFLPDGTLITHALLAKGSDNYALFTLFTTNNPFRGRGIGKQFIEQVVKMTAPMTVELDAALGRPGFYQRMGFKGTPITMKYFSGQPDQEYFTKTFEVNKSICIKQSTSNDLELILKYDRTICQMDRGKFLSRWLLDDASKSCFALDPSSQHVLGYINIRPDFVRTPGIGTYRISGFYADNITVAIHLLRHAIINYLPDCKVISFRYPDTNDDSVMKVFDSFNKKIINEKLALLRMRYGDYEPQFAWKNIYSLASPYNTYV